MVNGAEKNAGGPFRGSFIRHLVIGSECQNRIKICACVCAKHGHEALCNCQYWTHNVADHVETRILRTLNKAFWPLELDGLI